MLLQRDAEGLRRKDVLAEIEQVDPVHQELLCLLKTMHDAIETGHDRAFVHGYNRVSVLIVHRECADPPIPKHSRQTGRKAVHALQRATVLAHEAGLDACPTTADCDNIPVVLLP